MEDLWSAAELDSRRGIHVYPLHHGAQSNHEIMRRGRSDIFEQNPVTIRHEGKKRPRRGSLCCALTEVGFPAMGKRDREARDCFIGPGRVRRGFRGGGARCNKLPKKADLGWCVEIDPGVRVPQAKVAP
jgi:hypothetical protein